MQRFSHPLPCVRGLGTALALAVAVSVTAPAALHGQAPPAPAAGMQPTLAAGDSVTTLVEFRSVEQIQKEIDELADQVAMASERYQAAKQIQVRADTDIMVKEAHIKTLEMEIELAKQQKDNLNKSDFEAKKKLAGLEKQLLERRKALRDREIAYWEASQDFAETRRKAFEAEMSLAQMGEQHARLLSTPNSPAVYGQLVELDKQLREAERRTLDGQIEAASKRESVAKQEAEVLRAKKEIFDAQVKVKLGG